MHGVLMSVHSIVTLLEGCKASATVVLGAAATLLITEVLTSVGGEEAFGDVPHVSRLTKRDIVPQQTPKLTNVLGILTASLHLGLVVWLWKRLLLTSHAWDRSVGGIVELGPIMSLLQHDGAVSELLDETILALDGGIGDLGDLVALEAVPTLVASRVDKVNNIQRINEVDERVTNVAVVCEINTQVHEVILSPAGIVDDVLQHSLVHLVWNVSQHDGSTNVCAFSDLVDVDVVVVGPRRAEMGSIDTRGVLATIMRAVELA